MIRERYTIIAFAYHLFLTIIQPSRMSIFPDCPYSNGQLVAASNLDLRLKLVTALRTSNADPTVVAWNTNALVALRTVKEPVLPVLGERILEAAEGTCQR